MNYRLINAIFTSVWAINKEHAIGYTTLLNALIAGEPLNNVELAEAREKSKSFVITGGKVTAGKWSDLMDANIPEGSTAVIPIRSEIMKYDEACGPRGTASFIKDIQAANQNPNIHSILLIVDSPGGMVDGTDILAEEIRNSKTPVTAYIDGLAASAAYWIISGAKKIIANSDIARIGSIGTMLSFADVKPYYEEMGVKFHEIYATASKDKNKMINDLLDGNYESYRQEVLDVINNKFMGQVKENRPALDASTLTGKVYFATEAKANGLIDEIGALDYAFSEAARMGQESQLINSIENNNQNQSNMKMTILAAWTAFATVLGLESGKDHEVSVESLEQLHQSLTDANASIETLTGEKKTAEDSIATLTADLKTAKDEAIRIQTEFDAFKASDASSETKAKTDADRNIETAKAEENNFAHNKGADNIIGKI